ncbi:UDP-N-acetylmuramoyl-L-alanine--D-glutamate ligase [Erythrobacteraceae bacterium CFH 75059]|uniref:UDP-N-acetylmuramoyl-L-alanine--D-glutamate ligase n=1 Tax=Qipengyuania thermophila TaxID=2509361 RepID=UPI00102292E5|nr:UDP-N-acetylmuramoyl-L-alanine--D-glutamate ligase [Qipengyuania thermophila]TCD06180.1 UDP-N-acetylmuramoyl-L-alanine--D-glutamate ligase [Erythrobacteraceae bacterium CFH 75059]
MITSTAWAGQRYVVFGLARSGRATAEALLTAGADLLVWDDDPQARAPFAGRAAIADPLACDLTGAAGIVVSPGVPLNRHPIARHARACGVPVVGDVELFAGARAGLPRHRVVGITGTNGKSTTTALVHHLLVTAGVSATMGGNIGLPILAQEPLPDGGVYVLELSSFQIDLTRTLACDVAVLLNVTPDHLDRYPDFDAYAAAKARLFAMQQPGQVAVVGTSDLPSRALADTLRDEGRDVRTIPAVPGLDQRRWPALQGPHNAQNAAAAIAVCNALGAGEDALMHGLQTFAGLPHRLQHIATRHGVAFVNDSKATNPASAALALAAFPPQDGRPIVHWIVGGQAKEAGLGPLADWTAHVAVAYTIGEAGPSFAAMLADRTNVEECGTLAEAVRRAAAAATKGDVVLLSPACASFDQFADFEERGRTFAALVGDAAAQDSRAAGREAGA